MPGHPTWDEVLFRGFAVPKEFRSDGCTWAPDRLFGVDLTPACRLHDFLLTYEIVPDRDANNIFRDHLKSLGERWIPKTSFTRKFRRQLWAIPVQVYYLIVRLWWLQPFGHRRRPLPAQWRDYARARWS